MFQTVYLCLVTGRMFFYLSPPTSNLNNIFLILFYFHFLKLNWGCRTINNKLIESNDLRVRKRSILRTQIACVKVRVLLVKLSRSVRSPFVSFVCVVDKSFVRRQWLLTSVKKQNEL